MSVKAGNVSFLAIIISLIVFTGCNGNNEDESPGSDLLGLWSVTFIGLTDCDDPADNQQDVGIICTSTDCRKYEFKSDGVLSVIDIYGSDRDVETGTYSVDGNQLSITIDNETGTVTYTIDNNTLTMQGREPDVGCSFEIRAARD